MVCLGNICRSPMAEGILRHKANQAGLTVEIDSCGTSNYHKGSGPDRRAIKCLKSKGIDISLLKARQFETEDFNSFDYIFAMDPQNLSNLKSLASGIDDVNKVSLFLELTHPKQNAPVPDPYWGGDKGFEHVFQLLDEACDKLIEKLS